MLPEALVRTILITNNGSKPMNVVLEPFWFEFTIAPADQIEFHGCDGDPEDVYALELVENYIVLWEWDSSSNDVKINGEMASDWANPSPSLFGDWIRREKERGESKSIVQLLNEAREKLLDYIAPFQFYSLCTIRSELAGNILIDRNTDSELKLDIDSTLVLELRTKVPEPIRLFATEFRLEIAKIAQGECILWEMVDGEGGPELVRVWYP